MEIRFTVWGNPVPKARARTFFDREKIVSKTPVKTADYESLVGGYASQVKPDEPINVPLALYFIVYIKRPKKYKNGDFAVSRADIDNYAKSLMDGMNKIIYTDDRLICKISGEKRFDDNPRVEIKIKTL